MSGISPEVIIQGFLAASLVWYAKSVRDVVTIVKLHEWRIEQLEKVNNLRRKSDLPSELKCP